MADDFNILGWSIHTKKKNAEALVVASKENGLEVNVDKTKYMVVSQDQDVGRSHSKCMLVVPFKGWKSSDIWEQPSQIKILFRNELGADWSQGMLAVIKCRIFYLPVCYPKI